MTHTPQHVHLVGSIGLPGGAEVFHTCGPLKLAGGVHPEEVRFDELGYALEGASYQDFLEARARADLPRLVRARASRRSS